ncbi:WD40/YVTN/BNR-like repeat-containing protein [Aliikangiella sp. IMCC44653]
MKNKNLTLPLDKWTLASKNSLTLGLSRCLVLGLMLISPLVKTHTKQEKTSGEQAEWLMAYLPGKPSLRASATSPHKLWVAGTMGTVWTSADLGKTWQASKVATNFNGDIRDLQVFDDSTAIAMSAGEGSDSRLYLTENAGKTWRLLLQNTHPKGFFDAIDFWDRHHGLLLGDPTNGYYTVLKTSDGGKSWSRIEQANLPAIKTDEAAFAASGNTLITVNRTQAWITTGGKSASAWFSTNQGENWTRVDVPIYQQTSTAGGYAVGQNQYQHIFVLGGDYLQRDANYPNLAKFNQSFSKPKFELSHSGNLGLRTAMQCIKEICLLTGKLGTDISFNNGNNWRPFSNQGFYTLAKSDTAFLAAGHDGRVGVLQIKHLIKAK